MDMKRTQKRKLKTIFDCHKCVKNLIKLFLQQSTEVNFHRNKPRRLPKAEIIQKCQLCIDYIQL